MVNIKTILFVALIVLIICPIFQTMLSQRSLSVSPSFVRQEIVDDPSDWQFWKPSSNTFGLPTHNGSSVNVDTATNISECKNEEIDKVFYPPDIESVSYISDGKKLNATIWLTSPFQEAPINDSVDIYQEEFQIKVTRTNYTLEEFITSNSASIFNIIADPTTRENDTTLVNNPAHTITYFVEIGQGYKIQKTQLWSVIENRAFNITYSVLLTNDSTFTDHITKINKMLDSFEISNNTSNTINSNERQDSVRENTGDFLLYQNNGINISYPSSWLKNDSYIDNDQSSIISFKSPFENEKVNEPSWHETFYTLALDINSVHDVGTDYRIKISRIPNDTWTGVWTSQIQEVSARDKNRVLMEYNNYTKFYEKENPYILFSFDLNTANLPKQYKAVLYVTDHFVINHKFCRLVDMTNWIIIPPPEFVMTTAPSSIELRPGDEKNVQIKLKGNTDLESEATLNTDIQTDDSLNASAFSPQKISIPPSEGGTSNLKLKISKDAVEQTYAIPISANISFPNSITNTGGDTFSNNRSVSITESANLTLTILPPISDLEKFQSLVTEVITPVAGVWTFLAGVGAVIIPLIIRIYNKRKKQNAKETADSKEKK